MLVRLVGAGGAGLGLGATLCTLCFGKIAADRLVFIAESLREVLLDFDSHDR